MAGIINSREVELNTAPIRTTESTSVINASIAGVAIAKNDTIFFYRQLDNSILPASITLTAVCTNITAPITFVWSYATDLDPTTWITIAGQTSSVITITNTNYATYLGSAKSVVFKVECSKIGFVSSSANSTIYYYKESDENVVVSLDNYSVNVPCNSLGNPTSTSNTGTSISVFIDGKALDYGISGANTYSVGTVIQNPVSSITLGSASAVGTKYVYSDITQITQNVVTVTFPITVRNRFGTAKTVVNLQQKFTKIATTDSFIDTTPPPTPTTVTITAGFTSIFIKHDIPTYTMGKGHGFTIVYGVEVADATVLKVFSDAANVAQFNGSSGTLETGTSKSWRIWLKWRSRDGYESTTPFGGTNGFYVKTTTIGNVDLGPLVVEAGNLAAGAVTATKLAVNAVDSTKFASGIEPITVVSTVPTTKSTNSIFNTTDGKLYRWNGTTYVSTVPTTDLSGTVSNAQIAGLAASKITGQLSDAQIADLAAAKVTGTISSTQIADGSISGTKFASGLEPITVVSTVPTTKSTNSIFNTTDGKLYRWNGTTYVSTVPTTDLSGTVTNAQITGLAASKITGQLSDAQIADLAAAKVTGQITSTQITDSAISTPKISAGAITTAKIAAGAVTANEIAANSITAGQIAAGAITTGKLAAGAVTANEIAAGAITTGKLAAGAVTANEIAADTITAGQLAAGAVTATEIAAGAITTAKIAAGAVTAIEISAGAITTAKIAAGAVTANEIAANSITAGQIAAGAITTAKLAAGAVTANEIAAGAITTGKLAAGAVTANEIAADTITAGQLAAGAVTATEIAAGAVTTDKLLVTGVGTAINDDPNTQDISAWVGSGLSIITDSTSPAGNTVLRCAAGGATVLSRRVALDLTKNYQFRIWTRQETGSSTTYLTVAFSDASDNNISGGTVGWSAGTYHYFGLVNSVLPGSWTEYRVSFGPGESYSIPSNAKYIRVGVLSNYTGTGTQLVTGVRLMLKADADLIVDGAIVATKLAANSIAVGTAAIQNGAITNAMINDLNANKINAGFISADRINSNTITADKIDSRNLTIKDGSGNIIFSAGQALDYTRVGGTKPPADADKTSSNTAAAIANQGSFATLSTITSGNISSYVAAAAIGSTYIADLNADKISAGSLKVGSYIQSQNYSSGSTGWRINSNGDAEFDSILIRRNQRVASGQVLANTKFGIVDGVDYGTDPVSLTIDTGYSVQPWFAGDIKSTYVLIASPGDVNQPGGGQNAVLFWIWSNPNYAIPSIITTINDFRHNWKWTGASTIKFNLNVSVEGLGYYVSEVAGIHIVYGIGWGLYKLT